MAKKSPGPYNTKDPAHSDILSWTNAPKNALVLNLRQMSRGIDKIKPLEARSEMILTLF